MDPRQRELIADYLASVATAVRLLRESGFEAPKTNLAWACNGAQHVGKLKSGIKYFKHGFGCRVILPIGEVDFDFGDQGQTDGFDAWRLTSFAEHRLHEYGFSDEEEVNAVFMSAVHHGHIKYSGYILHYLAANEA